VTYSKWKKK